MDVPEPVRPPTPARTAGRPLVRRLAGLLLTALVSLTALSAGLGVAPEAAAEPTGSAVTLSAADYYQKAWHSDAEREAAQADAPFPDLKVTISQTTDLIEQGIRVSWTGGRKSMVPNQQTGGTDFLQIMQCWGDEEGSDGTRPDRTTCQYGGFATPGATRWSTRSKRTVVAEQDEAYTDPGTLARSMVTAIPFRSATGKTVSMVVDGTWDTSLADINSNEFFTKYTTNEVPWAGSGPDGTGSVSFEIQTAQQAPGLGCGTPVKVDGTTTGTSCWLVVIPRGEKDAYQNDNILPGLVWDNWKHHLAVKLEFSPLGLRCPIGAAERQLSGSELVAGAIGQWQPALCGKKGGAAFALLTGPESDAVGVASGTEPAPLALTSRALDAEEDPLAYAPIALTGVSVAFAIDRQSRAEGIGAPVPGKVRDRDQLPLTTMRLTPRLLAKLLTNSYRGSLPTGAELDHLGGNPDNITQDPEFLAINDPDWSYQLIHSPSIADLLVPLGRSDSALAVWEYVLADPEAAEFLAGKPDAAGMKVNPHYSTNAGVNPSGVAFELPTDQFPKADPVERAGDSGPESTVNLVTWRPYLSSLESSAYHVLRGDGRVLGAWDSFSSPPKYGVAARSLPGYQKVIGLTHAAAAARYEVVQAALRNPAGEFVAPTTTSLTAAAEAMTADPAQPAVLGFRLGSAEAVAAKAAYPLTMPVYAATNPKLEDADVRADYAAFISYAATDGQKPGTDDGELPPGYAPLPDEWRKSALTAAEVIKAGGEPSPSPSPSASASASPSNGTTPTPLPQQSAPATAELTPAPTPTPSRATTGPLTGANTPEDPAVGALAAAVPATGLVGLAAALGIPMISRFRRSP